MNECLNYFNKNGWDDWCNTLWVRISDTNIQRLVKIKTGAEFQYPKMGMLG